ncbi:MAG: hypothetical protein ABSB28_01150 [Candidatus Bathyarchaeia archaeon]
MSKMKLVSVLVAALLLTIVSVIHIGPAVGSGTQDSSGSWSLAASGTTTIFVEPDQLTVFRNDTFIVNVTLTNVSDLCGWQFDLYWNRTVLSCINATINAPPEWGDFNLLYGHGLQANYNATHGCYSKAQTGVYPEPSFNGSMSLVTLTFEAIHSGTTALTLGGTKLGNSLALPIKHTALGGSVKVLLHSGETEPPQTPDEPNVPNNNQTGGEPNSTLPINWTLPANWTVPIIVTPPIEVFPNPVNLTQLVNWTTVRALLMNITIVPATIFTYEEVTNMTWPYISATNITLPMLVNTTLPILFFVPFTATPASGPPGIFVTVSGHYASGGEIQVYLNNTQVASVAKPSSGDWSTSFQVPSVSLGNYTIRAVDTGARIISFASFSVTSEVSLSPTPLLLLIGFFALAVFSGLVMLTLLAVYTRQRKKSISDRH